MRYLLLFILVVPGVVRAQSTGQPYDQNYTELSQIPSDSINAEQMKIWIPVKTYQTMVTVEITTNGRNIVRHLLRKTLPNGYYNIFWNKKDDSGRYVPEGTYLADIHAGPYRKQLPLKVRYRPGENACYYTVIQNERKVELEIVADSVLATLQFYDSRDRLAEIVFKDSLLTRGKHVLNWVPSDTVYPGKFTGSLLIGEYEHTFPMRYTLR